jgi:hypothetical protein
MSFEAAALDVHVVPEPSSVALAALGVLGFLTLRRFRAQSAI